MSLRPSARLFSPCSDGTDNKSSSPLRYEFRENLLLHKTLCLQNVSQAKQPLPKKRPDRWGSLNFQSPGATEPGPTTQRSPPSHLKLLRSRAAAASAAAAAALKGSTAEDRGPAKRAPQSSKRCVQTATLANKLKTLQHWGSPGSRNVTAKSLQWRREEESGLPQPAASLLPAMPTLMIRHRQRSQSPAGGARGRRKCGTTERKSRTKAGRRRRRRAGSPDWESQHKNQNRNSAKPPRHQDAQSQRSLPRDARQTEETHPADWRRKISTSGLSRSSWNSMSTSHTFTE